VPSNSVQFSKAFHRTLLHNVAPVEGPVSALRQKQISCGNLLLILTGLALDGQRYIAAREYKQRTPTKNGRRIAETTAPLRARRGAVDVIFALTSFAMFAMLRRDRSVDDVCALLKTACRSALDPLSPDRRRSSRP
jgi:hypothetical protein